MTSLSVEHPAQYLRPSALSKRQTDRRDVIPRRGYIHARNTHTHRESAHETASSEPRNNH